MDGGVVFEHVFHFFSVLPLKYFHNYIFTLFDFIHAKIAAECKFNEFRNFFCVNLLRNALYSIQYLYKFVRLFFLIKFCVFLNFENKVDIAIN